MGRDIVCAQGDDPPRPNGPTRRWDPIRRLWVEAASRCRDTLGRWAKKDGTEPHVQLVLPFGSEEAA